MFFSKENMIISSYLKSLWIRNRSQTYKIPLVFVLWVIESNKISFCSFIDKLLFNPLNLKNTRTIILMKKIQSCLVLWSYALIQHVYTGNLRVQEHFFQGLILCTVHISRKYYFHNFVYKITIHCRLDHIFRSR